MARPSLDFSGSMPVVYHGATKVLSFTVSAYDGDGTRTGVQNVTGWTVMLNIFSDPSGSTLVLAKTGTISVGTDGVVTVTLTSTNTGTTLAGSSYWAELCRTDSGSEDVLAVGSIPMGLPRVQ